MEDELYNIGIPFDWVGIPTIHVNPIIKVEESQKKEFIEKLDAKGLFFREKFN